MNFTIDQWIMVKKTYIEMYSTHNKEKSVFAEKFIKNLKIKFVNTWINFQKMFIYW